MNIAIQIHKIINSIRRNRHLPEVAWSDSIAKLALSQAIYCARVNKIVHSSRYAFEGGENIAQGSIYCSPRSIVKSWMQSDLHRDYLLSNGVKQAGVGIARSRTNTYVAWAFEG